MEDQQKLYRVFKLIRYLSQRPYRSIAQLAKLLDASERTIYRYIQLLESLDYLIDKDEHNRFFLHVDYQRDSELISPEEAGYLQDMLWQLPNESPHRDRLLHKLNQQFTLAPLVQSQNRLQVFEHIRMLGHAIEGNLRVRLHNYLKSDGEIRNAYGEPVEFQEGYAYLYLYDLDREDYRQFKIERIGRVEVLDERISGEHASYATDLFGLSGREWLPVRLSLSTRAYQLMAEEYPDARPFLRSHKGRMYFDGTVRNFRGVGRFVLGLPGEIIVEGSEEFKAYLRERAGSGYGL
jgi:predicted DNA-binding transcriptional regulator YafY